MELQDRYGEVVAMLHEAQADLRHIREKRADFSGYESLFSELEDALEQEKRQQHNNSSLPTGYSTDRTNDSGYSSARERESSAEARTARRRRNNELNESGYVSLIILREANHELSIYSFPPSMIRSKMFVFGLI